MPGWSGLFFAMRRAWAVRTGTTSSWSRWAPAFPNTIRATMRCRDCMPQTGMRPCCAPRSGMTSKLLRAGMMPMTTRALPRRLLKTASPARCTIFLWKSMTSPCADSRMPLICATMQTCASASWWKLRSALPLRTKTAPAICWPPWTGRGMPPCGRILPPSARTFLLRRIPRRGPKDVAAQPA